MEKEDLAEKTVPNSARLESDTAEVQRELPTEVESLNINEGPDPVLGKEAHGESISELKHQSIGGNGPDSDRGKEDNDDLESKVHKEVQRELPTEVESLNINEEGPDPVLGKEAHGESIRELKHQSVSENGPDSERGKEDNEMESKILEDTDHKHKNVEETSHTAEEVLGEGEKEDPVFDGTEVPGMEANRSTSTRSSLDGEPETPGSVWPEKATALKNFVKEKSVVAVSTVLRRLSGKKDDYSESVPELETSMNNNDGSSVNNVADSSKDAASPKPVERATWNPLSFIRVSRDVDAENKTEQTEEIIEGSIHPIAMKGRILLYTRLGCQDCKAARLFLHWKRLRYVEINIDVYPSRKLELEKISGSSAVPKVLFNETLIGGLSELKALDESGKMDERINYLINEAPSMEAPIPPLSGEDDESDSGAVDELAVIVRKMKGSIVVKDRFCKMRRFTSCFLGSDAVDFLSEDQYLEREEAIEFGRKLASKLFFAHVLDENVFEDGNHIYRFLDDDPIVSQCHNIPRGIIDVKPMPIVEIASRLRYVSYAIFEAYTSDDGKHVDYRSIHGSEEFARYLRLVQELQRVDLQDMAREEKLAFFINLYNMMAIHAILVLGYPVGPLERRKLFGDFKYVVGGSAYSLSAIQNGILRGNQRPPYNLIKPFAIKDKRAKVALPYPEPLVHFALVCGNRSGPGLRWYSPGDIDKELVEAARNFLRSGGLIVDFNAKVASVSKILRWYSVDFGKSEMEVLKHAANYIEPSDSEALLELLANSQFKIAYQPYDWGVNC